MSQFNQSGMSVDEDNFEIGEIVFTKHENKNIIEVEVNNVLIAKNKDDDIVNVTQLLTLAGLKNEDMAKILDSEFVTERTEIDDGKYKGIWIKTATALTLAKKYKVEKPLEMLVNEKKTLSRSFSVVTENDEITGISESPLKKSKLSTSESTESDQPEKDLGHDQSQDHKQVQNDTNNFAPESASYPHTLEPISLESIPNYDELKTFLSQLFSDKEEIITETLNELSTSETPYLLDIPFDHLGNTILHWAATLENIPLVIKLVSELHINMLRGNNEGETSLMRVVGHTNYYENFSFEKLLDILYPLIPILDHKNRTVIHHIAITAGEKGRTDASKYYLSSLIEWIIKHGEERKCMSFQEFRSSFINLRDSNGDTALNILARIGNKSVADQLLEIGADPKITNKAGLNAFDFRLKPLADEDGTKSATQADAQLEKQQINGTANGNGHAITGSKNLIESFDEEDDEMRKKVSNESQEILRSMGEMMAKLSSNFENELTEKQKEIKFLYKELKESTNKLTLSRQQLKELRESENKLNEIKQKITNIDKSIASEESYFESKFDHNAEIPKFDGNTTYDPDQPFKNNEIFTLVKQKLQQNDELDYAELQSRVSPDSLPPTHILKARIAAYKENEEYLQNLNMNLDKVALDLENKFRHVVALCTNIEESKVDDLLEGLVRAVESDPEEVDVKQVTKFLAKVYD